MESTADGILVVDGAGKITDFNHQFVRLWRIPASVIATRDDNRALDYVLAQLNNPNDFIDKVRLLYAHPEADSFDTLEFKDGRIFERYSRPQMINGKPVGRVWSFRDVTKQRMVEQRLKETAEELQTLFNAARDGFLVADIITKNFVYANPRMCRMTGYTESELLDMNIIQLHPPEDLPLVLDYFTNQVQGKIESAPDVPILKKDGQRTYCDINASVIEIGGRKVLLGLFHDTTERKQYEDELRTTAYWLKESQRISRVGSYLLDIPTGIWTSSEVLDEVFGIGPDYPRTIDGWAEVVHPDHRLVMTNYFITEVVGKRQPFNREYMIVRKNDGQARYVMGLGALTFDNDGNPLKMIGTIQDITDRKRAEEETLRLEAQILQAQKLESLGVLTGGIAHDFNNMLMVILGNADLAQRSLPADSPVQSRIANINNVAKSAAALCNQMLTYSGKGHFNLSAINISDIIDDMGRMFEVAISKKVTMRYCLARDLPSIEADVTQIRQVIMNLIINASDAIGDNDGTIIVTTGLTNCDCNIPQSSTLYGTITEGPHVFLKVADTGCGIDPATMTKLFDPFYTTKSTGRGLGLAVVMGIVRMHKGAIRVQSEPGLGTTFSILFPASNKSPSAALPVAPAQDDTWRGNGLILLVDDEETVRNVCGLLLECIGFTVLAAADGRQAVKLFRQYRTQITCSIIDLAMPNMNGEETFDALSKIDPKVRVLISSGYSESAIATRFAGKSIAGYIQKPFQMADLRTAMKSILDS